MSEATSHEILPKDETLRLRQIHIGGSVALFFKHDPMKIVRGEGQYMFDEQNDKYLDCINNVAHVGHCHPRVVEAANRQMSLIYTNCRYLHDNLVLYAKRLTSYFPANLSVCYFVNSGSEANDLALRLARAHTKHKDIITLDGAYHGHLTNIVEISPYKFNQIKGHKKKNWVHVAPIPCSYRGKYTRERYTNEEISSLYAQDVRNIVNRAEDKGRKIAAFISESLISCGGQVVLPPNYLQQVYQIVRESGGVCIADEVQIGFGRVGTHMWGFQTQSVVPDIVTLGKPIGNGHPVACVVTTLEIAASFEGIGAEYFNTYGGNPVSLAVANAVLDVIEDEKLLENAANVGGFMIDSLKKMRHSYPIMGDVRGLGMFFGVELIEDQITKTPAVSAAKYAVRRFRDERIIMSTEGKDGNVLKFKPPMVFNMDDARLWLKVFDDIMSELTSIGHFRTTSVASSISGDSLLSASDSEESC